MPSLRALIWDVDGTLAETEKDGHRVAFNHAFAAAGLPWHWGTELYGELLAVTGGKERLRHYWQRIDPVAATDAAAGPRIAALHAAKTERYLAAVRAGAIALRPGVARLLREARAAGLRLAIATTTTGANVHELLRHALAPDGCDWFEYIGAGDVVGRKKPAPDIYRWVLERLRLPGGDCLAIEDSAAGAASARAAGVPVVVTRSTYTRDEDVGAVCADLGGFGEPGCPAGGRATEGAVRGFFGLADLRRWHAAGACDGSRAPERIPADGDPPGPTAGQTATHDARTQDIPANLLREADRSR